MLASALNTIKAFLGVASHGRQPPKRPLDEESEEEYEDDIHASEPQQKKRCTSLGLTTPTPAASNPAAWRFPWIIMKGDDEPAATSKVSSRVKKAARDEAEVVVVEDFVENCRQGQDSVCDPSLFAPDEEVQGRREERKLCELATRRPPLAHSGLADFRFVPSAAQHVDQGAARQRSRNLNFSKSSQSQKPSSSKVATDFKGYFDRLWGRKKSTSILSSRIKCSMVQRSFRHEEKMRYRQLLQQYTEHYLTPSSKTFPQQASSSLSSPIGMVTRTQLTPQWTKQKKQQIERSSLADKTVSTGLFESGGMVKRDGDHGRLSILEEVGSTTVPLVDLSKEDSADSFASTKESDSNSIIVVKEVLSPTVYKNSLEEKLKEHPVYDLNWVKSMRKEYEEREQTAVKNVDVTRKVIQDLEERRNRRASLDEKVTQRLQLLDLSYPAKYSELPDEEEEAFVPLTPEMESEVDDALNKTPPSEVLIEKFHMQITRRDIATLDGLNWLNDEVINFYMNLIMERGQKNDNYPSVYAFNTFFYPKLSKSGYQSVRRWTKKVDIFSHDMLLVPIHLGMHWCMAHVDFKMKCISYYDSMLSSNERCLQSLLEYLNSEHQDKKGSPYVTSDWNLKNKKKIPQQMNGSDCGMFACKFAEYLSRRARINFDQEHMPYFRRRMVYEIINAKLL